MSRRLRPLPVTPLLVALTACGDGGDARTDDASQGSVSLTQGGSDSGSGSDSGTGTGSSSSAADSSGGGCAADCEGVCIDGLCCALESACGEVCCAAGDVCSFQQCVTPGVECVDASECDEGQYCEYSLGEPGMGGGMGMCQGGESLATGKCLPEPPLCPDGVEPPADADDIDCLPACEVIPEGGFEPTVKYHWQGGDSMMAPMVIQLDDDNCDQIVDERDIPEIVFATFDGGQYTVNGTLRAISIVGGAVTETWAVNPQSPQLNPGLSIATGDIDGSPGNEIVGCSVDGRAMAFDHDGTLLWVASTATGCFMPSIADFDQDGFPEVLTEASIYDGVTGVQEATFAWQQTTSAADMDGDGALEVVGPRYIFEADGTMLADSGVAGYQHAVADLDLDGEPEVAAINRPAHALYVWRYVPGSGVETIRAGIDINDGLPPCAGGDGGGPPTIADFNGDGVPDVGVAAGVGYTVFDGQKIMDPTVMVPTDTILWLTPAVDCSSRATGSSVFDFDGDGKAEVVYGDEQYLRIYDGTTGTVLFETCNTTGTLWEYPIITDVDSDGHADIIAVSNSYSSIICPADSSKQQGVRVFGDVEGRWVRTRRVWNQHHYHVTNIDEDGTIPAVEQRNWVVDGLNNFRQNVQPEGEFAAPDLVVSVLARCEPNAYALVARVRNIGQAAVPAGVAVGFYDGDPGAGGTLLGSGVTNKTLYPAEAEDVVLPLDPPPQALVDGSQEAWVVVDDGMPAHAWKECRTDNDVGHAPVPCQIAG
ncbi:MAG: FG-GAP-like repeat-containing protein [Nannocystaceae bacterium]|nr:FG-GAP-like repeat-containing protein [Nannocystaceae bacterium]